MIESTLEFKVHRSKRVFKVRHNLDELNMGIESAFENWSVRTESVSEITVENFCQYVKSKDTENIICDPVERFEKEMKSKKLKV